MCREATAAQHSRGETSSEYWLFLFVNKRSGKLLHFVAMWLITTFVEVYTGFLKTFVSCIMSLGNILRKQGVRTLLFPSITLHCINFILLWTTLKIKRSHISVGLPHHCFRHLLAAWIKLLNYPHFINFLPLQKKKKRHCWAHVCDKHKCTHALSKYGCKYAARCQPPPPQFHNWEQRLRTIYELTLQTASTTHCRQAHMER